ncbi:histidine phosphatase family protein [Streptomyces armeniacus]|uniref:Histidine phosphatase family protein n=1 Tax=Streptomyces armeniacus TaxID=83291 RepID=A0A345XRG9_9ACTN|nr:histidine phosphatase family protein [Streptomyces armeniacus]AXK34235.1 histidine phosphatase family protein [Streptomyces armeniacus]
MSVDVPRSIVLLRHAKADWPDVADHDRPLADRGRKDAPAVGEWLAAHGITPQLTLCSTAARTRETWKLLVPKLPERPRTVYEERLYEASTGEIITVLNEVPNDVRDVLVVAHNPGVQSVADTLSGSAEGDALERMSRGGFPTSALAVIRFVGPWKSVEPGAGTLAAYRAPHE